MTTPTPPPSGQEAVVRGSAVWLPPGAPAVTVGDYVIPGGFLYVGTALPAAYAPMYEPGLVDPRLPVRRIRLDQETPDEGSRPGYVDLTPGARGAYLEWLAAGRTGPTPAAHLWLFLYGLERRVLVDLVGSHDVRDEYAVIAAEVTRLRDRYPQVAAFDEQVTLFTDLLDALIGLADPALQPPPLGPRTGELPLRLRVGIGRYVARRLPVSVGWAYSWHAYSPTRRWGPAATQRPEEFRRAFEARYAQAYPSGGMSVPAPPEELSLAYRPASPGFADRIVRVHTNLPDVRAMTAPLAELADIAILAEADISGNGPAPGPRADAPDVGASPEVPAPAPDGRGLGARLAEATEEAERAAQAAQAPPAAQAAQAPPAAQTPPAPDLPYTGGRASEAAQPHVSLDARPQLAAAEALLRMVTLAGIADGYVRAVRRHVVDVLGLTAAERHQLDDRLDGFARTRPTATVVRHRFAALGPAQREAVARLLISAAGANGIMEPEHAAVLEAVFDTLGPGREDLHRRLRDLEVAAVVDESDMDVTVLDEAVVEETLADAVSAATVVDALVRPAWSRYATTAAGSVITDSS